MTRAKYVIDDLKSFGVDVSPEKQERIAKVLADNERDKPAERQPRGVYQGLKRGRKPKVKK
jgi:hypothetical protein